MVLRNINKLWNWKNDKRLVFFILEREREKEGERERERERECEWVMKKEGKDGNFEALTNGDYEEQVSSSRFSSLLESRDRDYLLTSTGLQVLFLSLHIKFALWGKLKFSLIYIYITSIVVLASFIMGYYIWVWSIDSNFCSKFFVCVVYAYFWPNSII